MNQKQAKSIRAMLKYHGVNPREVTLVEPRKEVTGPNGWHWREYKLDKNCGRALYLHHKRRYENMRHMRA
jgi:hypothetical protein